MLEENKVAISTTVVSLLIGSGLGTKEEGNMLPITTNVIYPELLTLLSNSVCDKGDTNERQPPSQEIIVNTTTKLTKISI